MLILGGKITMGFKKSLFGFNCDEVMNYIENMHKTAKETELVLNEKLDDATSKLEASTSENAELKAKNELLSAELKEITEKYNEIEKISENIGKLYLVAQTNAKTIMDNALANKEITDEETKKNLEALENAQSSFDSLKENIIKSSYDFVADVDSLLESLNSSKEKINTNANSDEEAKKDFETVYETIVK